MSYETNRYRAECLYRSGVIERRLRSSQGRFCETVDEARADAQAFLEWPQNFYVAVYDHHERRVVDVLRQPDVTEPEKII